MKQNKSQKKAIVIDFNPSIKPTKEDAKEANAYFVDLTNQISIQASLFAGFSFTAIVSLPLSHTTWLESLFLITSGLCILFEFFALVITGTLAFTTRIIDIFIERFSFEFDSAWYCHVIGMFLFIVSLNTIIWLRMSFGFALTLTVLSFLILLITISSYIGIAKKIADFHEYLSKEN